jgi:hypothetical protein
VNKFHSNVIIKGNDTDTKEMKKLKKKINPPNPSRPEVTLEYKKNKLALKELPF